MSHFRATWRFSTHVANSTASLEQDSVDTCFVSRQELALLPVIALAASATHSDSLLSAPVRADVS